jgi:hypothetical protein
MIGKWLSAGEIAGFASIKVRSVQRRADKERRPVRTEKARGGTYRIYQAAALPAGVQAACAASLKPALTELQSRIKPRQNMRKR